MSRKATKPTAKPNAKATKKSTVKNKPTKKSQSGRGARGEPAGGSTPGTKRAPAAKSLTVFVVQQKASGAYGDTLYTEPDRVFADKKAAQQYADTLNRELIALGDPFSRGDITRLITGGDTALTALVTPLKLPLPNKSPWANVLDWASWWNENYFNMTDEQRNSLCLALNKFEWYQVRTTTLE